MKWNEGANFAQIFEEAALRAPQQLAVVDGEKSWTYAQMHKDVVGTARWLREERGVQPNENVCIRMHNSYELLVSCLALNSIDTCWMPPSVDPPKSQRRNA